MYSVDDHYFDTIDTEEKAYWLGFFAADGSIGESNKVILRLASIDCSHIEKFKEALKSQHNIVTKTNKKGFSNSCIVIRSTLLTKALAKYSIIPHKTFSVRKPQLSTNLLRHYWRGVFDGDGSIYKLRRDGQTNISLCGNPLMIQDYINDVKKYLNIDIKIENKKKIQYAYSRRRLFVLSILDWLYSDAHVYLDRKYDSYLNFKLTYKPSIREKLAA